MQNRFFRYISPHLKEAGKRNVFRGKIILFLRSRSPQEINYLLNLEVVKYMEMLFKNFRVSTTPISGRPS
jgi:hypothetical protein